MIVPNQATKSFIQQHLKEDIHLLALKKAPQEVNLPLAVLTIAARQSLQKKVPSWSQKEDLLFPQHLSLEQASSEVTAEYKAQWIIQNISNTATLIDLTGGLGIDCYFMGKVFKEVHYCEQQSILCELARHNFPILNQKHISIHQGESKDILPELPLADVLFIDPARRDTNGKKTVTFEDCTPNVIEWQEQLLAKAPTVIIKASPMLDISLALEQLQNVKEVHIISVNGECKELLFIVQRDYNKETQLHCKNHVKGAVQSMPGFTLEKEKQLVGNYAYKCSNYLYEPNASILKAGAYKSITNYWNITALHPSSHVYTSDNYYSDFPGRIFQINKCIPFNKKEIKKHLKEITKCNITTRNFPLSVAQIREKFKLKDGGSIYLFATTLSPNEKCILICTKYPNE